MTAALVTALALAIKGVIVTACAFVAWVCLLSPRDRT